LILYKRLEEARQGATAVKNGQKRIAERASSRLGKRTLNLGFEVAKAPPFLMATTTISGYNSNREQQQFLGS
jgi:hypothetical protein